MHNIKAIFWDCDGTLVNSEKIYFDACRKVFKKYKVEITDEFIQKENFAKNTSVLELLKRAGFSDETIEQARVERNKTYADFLQENVRLFDHIKPILDYLKGKIPMAIVSNAPRSDLDITLKKCLLNQYFDFIVTKEDVTTGKPNPEIYLLAISKAGLKPEDCLAIEDNIRGVTAAKSAGIRCFLVPSSMTPQQDYHHADKVFTTGNQLLEYFKTISS